MARSTSILGFLLEMSSYTEVTEDLKRKAEYSHITTLNNKFLSNIMLSWFKGDYDETPETVVFEIGCLLRQ